MKPQCTPQRLSPVGGFFRDILALVGALPRPRRLVPVPVPGRRRSASGTPHRTPPRRLTGWLLLLVGFVLLAAMPAGAEPPALPAGVPDIYDPEVRANFGPVRVVNLRGNPDFPALLLVNTTGEQPRALVLGLDARNGQATWSLTTDPIILIMVFSDETTIQGVYVDTGFADRGKASGSYAAVDTRNPSALPDLFKKVPEPVTGPHI